MTHKRQDEFYIGYAKRAPQGLSRFVRHRVAALYVLAATIAAVCALAQGRFAVAYFEFGQTRTFEGFVTEHPYPTLLVRRPPSADTDQVPFSRYFLTVFGKRGAEAEVAGLDGQKVRLSGTLIYRDDQTMIEIVDGSVKPIGDDRLDAHDGTTRLGRFKLAGEIVDSKCYLGVMKPGNLKPHRSCAIRCIDGGIPPLFVARDKADNTLQFLMVGSDGRRLNSDVLDFVADQIELEGEVIRDGAMLILRTEPESFRRRY